MDLPRPIARLLDALNSHDPAAVAACFTEDYRAEIPIHPAQSFIGNAQVRQNWFEIFSHLPDLRAVVLRCTGTDDVSWSEWEMSGTDPDGVTAVRCGVVIAEASGGKLISRTRFYIEPVS